MICWGGVEECDAGGYGAVQELKIFWGGVEDRDGLDFVLLLLVRSSDS